MRTTRHAAAAAAAAAAAVIPALAAATPPPSPHADTTPTGPVITEALYNVPKGDAGDANRDGARHPAGDEFVELFNPSADPIDLTGWSLHNRLTWSDPDTKRGVRFTFPDFTLPPGAIVVVFNGVDADIPHPPGALGTPEHAPARTNASFAHAWVFTADNTSRNNAFSNAGDFVLLADPAGSPIDALWWGDPDPAPPQHTTRQAEVPKDPKGSVQRTAANAAPVPHRSIDRRPSSPGELPPPPTP